MVASALAVAVAVAVVPVLAGVLPCREISPATSPGGQTFSHGVPSDGAGAGPVGTRAAERPVDRTGLLPTSRGRPTTAGRSVVHGAGVERVRPASPRRAWS